MKPGNAEFDQPLALPGGIIDAQLNCRFIVVFDLDQLAFQLRWDLRAAERRETANLRSRKNRQDPWYNRHADSRFSYVFNITTVCIVVEKQLGNYGNRPCIYLLLQVFEVGRSTLCPRVNLRKTSHGDGEAAQHHRFTYKLRCMVKTVWMRLPIHHTLGRITAESKYILDSLFAQFFKYRSGLVLGLADDR